jgi:7,8-dihydropterin-6-yl-methyl-4-(beta-D-ribofuranosyl)aminobenzene 5'-phosphate synthase
MVPGTVCFYQHLPDAINLKIIGGLHLGGPELAPRIQPTVDFLSRRLKPPPKYILPMHCTGFRAKVALAAEFGERCVAAGVGIKVEIKGDREQDKVLVNATLASGE